MGKSHPEIDSAAFRPAAMVATHGPGASQEHAIVDECYAVKIPDSMSFIKAALLLYMAGEAS